MTTNDQWHNHDNLTFYEALKPEGLRRFAEMTDLVLGNDLTFLSDLCLNSHHTLEVGAGYGRVIDALIGQGHPGQITAIECCQNSYHYLSKKYQKTEGLSLVHDDINHYQTTERFDLILYLWSGLADFPATIQPEIVKKLAQLLSENGTLVIDSYALQNTPLESVQTGQQSFQIKENNQTKYIYEPTTTEIKNYAQLAELSYHECIEYANKERTRYLHILKSKN